MKMATDFWTNTQFSLCSFKTSAFICTIWFDLYDLQSCFMNNNNITVYILFFLLLRTLASITNIRFVNWSQFSLSVIWRIVSCKKKKKKSLSAGSCHVECTKHYIFRMKHLAKIYIKWIDSSCTSARASLTTLFIS